MKTAFSGTNSIEVLKKTYEDDTDDITMKFRLAYKYHVSRLNGKDKKKLFEEIMADPRSKEIKVPYRFIQDEDKVYIYEYLLHLTGKRQQLIDEYPDSRFAKDAYNLILSKYYADKNSCIEDGLEIFNKALKIFPDEIAIKRQFLMFLYFRNVSDPRGLEITEKLMKQFQTLTPDLVLYHAYILDNAGKDRELHENFGKSFMDEREQWYAAELFNYGKFWLEKKENNKDAAKRIEESIKLQPAYTKESVRLLINAEQKDAAIRMYGPEYISEFNDNAQALRAYADFWVKYEMNLESALSAIERAAELSPTTMNIDAHAVILMKLDRYEEALTVIEKGIENKGKHLRLEKRLKEIRTELDKKKGK